MQRRELNIRLNWILFIASLVTFFAGFVLLICFHMGDGVLATSALGRSRLFWLNLHRLSAIVVVAGAALHVGLHWRAFTRVFANIAARKKKRSTHSELIMYIVFTVAAVTGLVAWWVLEGTSPLFGPVLIGRANSVRHPWVDTHHLTSIVLFVFIVHHVGHRFRFMIRRRGPAGGQSDRKGLA